MVEDKQYLVDIVQAADDIALVVAGVSQAEFMTDRIRQLAAMQAIAIIGEAAGKVSDDVKNRYAQVPWSQMTGTRHRVIHGYASVKLGIVWETAAKRVPILREQIARILTQEFGHSIDPS